MTEEVKQTQPTFDQMFQDMINRINSYGVSFQTAIGLIAAIDNQIKMELAEKQKEQQIIKNWEQHKKNAEQPAKEPPAVEVEEAN